MRQFISPSRREQSSSPFMKLQNSQYVDESPKTPATRLLLIYPNRLMREGLMIALSQQDGFEITARAPELMPDLLQQAKELNPDIIVLGGLENSIAVATTRMLAATCKGARIIVIEISESDNGVLECIEAGAGGYVLRDATFDELVKVIEAVARGESFVSPQLAATLCRRLAVLRRLAQPLAIAGSYTLSRREAEVVELIVSGLQNKEIAARLHIETQTVKNHVHNILEKLGLRSRHEIARRAQLDGSYSRPV